MNIDERIALAKEMIAKREDIDRQLAELFGGAVPARKARSCKLCGASDHDARSCPQAEKPVDPSKLI
jgi:hypothetical protein